MIPQLTHREHQVLQLITEGLSNKLIAGRLHISAHTIKYHVRNACMKFKTTSRVVAAVAYARMQIEAPAAMTEAAAA